MEEQNLNTFIYKQDFSKILTINSKLYDIHNLINWNTFRTLFPKQESNLGRPAYDEVLMIKILILQSLYNISDEELEFLIYDRISFREFLDFPTRIPDSTTIRNFKTEISQLNIEDKIFDEFKSQIRTRDITVKQGHIQDATFIQAQPGKTKPGKDDRSRDISKTSRNRDGTWTKKGKRSYFGYKLHVKTQRGSKLIETIAVTPANVDDRIIDLMDETDIAYRDRGYVGGKTKAKGDGTMKRGNLSIWEKLRNKRISKRRAEGEHPFGVISRVMHGGTTKLTTVTKVYTQQLFVAIGYNLLRTLFLIRS